MIPHTCEIRKAEIKVGINPMPKKVGQYPATLPNPRQKVYIFQTLISLAPYFTRV
jgi:hypothetical protein